MAMLFVMIIDAETLGVFQYISTLASNAPMVIPGQAALPSKMSRANPIPAGGQAGKAIGLSKAKKYIMKNMGRVSRYCCFMAALVPSAALIR